jgi:DNA helicase-2/ATP-dependent DNA helicase PcrA
MTTTAEHEERARLETVKTALRHALWKLDARLDHYDAEIKQQKEHMWDARRDMDHIEKIAARQSIEQSGTSADVALDERRRLQKLLHSPYFGRVDFLRAGEAQVLPVYVGVHSFTDEEKKAQLVYDWRAPISTLFYDVETGPAQYVAPGGTMRGEVTLKRQFRIRDGELDFVLESGLNIHDEVLQETLSRAADDKMKHIVATIQRDQNAIVRNEEAQTIIIQGVAGSGKTSIALHRIAFLLYRFKDTLSSQDILIISPNKVFADYISRVLPELGEEQIAETEMDALAAELLEHQYRCQTFFEQTALLAEKDDPELQARIREKSTLAFLKQIDAYAEHVDQTCFQAREIRVGRRIVPDWFIDETFRKHRGMSLKERMAQLVHAIELNLGIYYNMDVMPEQRAAIKVALKTMVKQSSLRETYKNFYAWLGRPELFKPAKHAMLEHADVFPLIHLKFRLEGLRPVHRNIKHLVIDEMQDYTPAQYAVLSRLFRCNKTILGDANQSVNPMSAATAETIRDAVGGGEVVRLNKSYRSSYEIARFSQRIAPNPDLDPVERHGEKPRVLSFKTRKAEIAGIRNAVVAFHDQRQHHTLGIVCKTQKQAEQLYMALNAALSAGENLLTLGGAAHDIHLLTAASAAFAPGVVLCSAHLAKGLEFDEVIVPQASAENYISALDRNLLYVACTRAMHRLTLTCVGAATGFVRE